MKEHCFNCHKDIDPEYVFTDSVKKIGWLKKRYTMMMLTKCPDCGNYLPYTKSLVRFEYILIPRYNKRYIENAKNTAIIQKCKVKKLCKKCKK